MPRPRKTPRADDTRENKKKPETYAPPPLLPMPEPIDGYVFKWIRKSSRGEIDTRNMARRAQQGWTLVRKEDYPHIASLVDPFNSTGEYIESGGLILAKIPEELAEQIRDYNTRRARAQVRAVDNTYFSLKDRGVEVFRDPDSRVRRNQRQG
jgi:hypothetical protein